MLIEVRERETSIVECTGIGGIELDGLIKVLDCSIVLIELQEFTTSVVKCIGIGGIELDGLIKVLDCSIE